MALGDLTKQIAQQALLSATAPAPKEPAAPPAPDPVSSIILGQVAAMQKALKDDEELVVLFHASGETVRVVEFFFPSWQVAVLTGADRGEVTRVISPVESLQLICKVAKLPPSATATRIRFLAPKP
jgi:hypothetical protein